ncbi:MAG: alpha-glucosidase, partial [Erysipelotrichales bacterium]|nr:alpha-glucosidase [Erysipelotrichales bacterium]
DFRKDDSMTLHFNERPVLYLGSGKTYEDISREMRKLFGYYGKLPDWVHDGAILAIQEGCTAVDRRVKAARDAGAKVCGVWSQDWCGCRRTGFGYQVMWNWEADEELYPNLKDKIQEWKAQGIHFLGYINPFMALEKPLYKYASEHGYCVKDSEGKDYLVTITTFPAAMIDFTNPDAYNWYKEIIKKNMIGIGLSGWMADFGEYLPMDAVLYNHEDAAKWHNDWPAIWARMNREAIEECGKKDEIFYFTRAGYTGSIGNTPMMWTGDQHVDWSVDDGLPSVIPASLSLAMSGQPVTHSDIGGYTTVMHMTRSKELLMRWEEMNVFTPLYRSHEGNQPSRNVQFDTDEELLKQLAKMSRLHAALKPYIKSLEKEAEEGIPMMRPLFYYYEKTKMDMTEYLFGRDFLVAPVVQKGAESRTVFLPEDEWEGLWDQKEYKPGEHTAKAPIGMIPVYVRNNHAVSEDVLDSLRKIMSE